MNVSRGDRISVAIVGAQKAATTAAIAWLGQHAELAAQEFRDIRYFTDDSEYAKGFEACRKLYFAGSTPDEFLVAKHANLWSLPTGLRRLAEHNPDVLVCVILRDPVERALSAFRFAESEGWESAGSVRQSVEGRGRRTRAPAAGEFLDYLGNGYYAQRLKDVYVHFPARNVYVVFESDLVSNPAAAFSSLLQRLQISPIEGKLPRVNQTGGQRSAILGKILLAPELKKFTRRMLPARMRRNLRYRLLGWNSSGPRAARSDVEDREWLAEYYRPRDAELRDLLGVSALPWDE